MGALIARLQAVVVWLQGKKTITLAGVGMLLGAATAFGYLRPEVQADLTGELGRLVDAIVKMVDAVVGVCVSLGSLIALCGALKGNRIEKALAENTAVTKAVLEKTPVLAVLTCCLVAAGLLTGCAQQLGGSDRPYSASLFPQPSISAQGKTTAATLAVGDQTTSKNLHLILTATSKTGELPLLQASVRRTALNQMVGEFNVPLDWAAPKAPIPPAK